MKIGHFKHTDPQTAPGKHLWIENGQLEKKTVGAFIRSKYSTLEIGSLSELKALLEGMQASEHLTSGIANVDAAIAVPAGVLAKLEAANTFNDEETGLPLISRSEADISRPTGQPGAMFVDSDGGAGKISSDLVIGELKDAQPGIDKYSSVQCTSSSSLISWAGGSKGVSGIHTVYHVANVADVPRALEALHVRLVLAGHAKHKLSASGAFLPRSHVDQALRPASQPIFARAMCGEGVKQDKPVRLNPGIEVMDTAKAIPALTQAERLAYADALMKARAEMQPEMARVAADYMKTRATDMARREGMSIAAATKIIQASVEIDTLAGGFTIHTGMGRVAVSEILDNPTAWHGKTCRDPEDPVGSSPTSAKIYCDQENPLIHSFAHVGGQKGRIYRLVRDLSHQDEADIEAAKKAKASQSETTSLALLINGITSVTTDQAAVETWAMATVAKTGETDLRMIPGFGLIREASSGHERVVAPVESFAKWMKAADPAIKAAWETVLPAALDIEASDPSVIADAVWRSISWAKKDDILHTLASWPMQRPTLATDIEVSFEMDADDVAGQKALIDARRGSVLLKQCLHIASDPLSELRKALDAMGVVGEGRATTFVFLTAIGASLRKPFNTIIKAQSSSGKSHSVKSVLSLFGPDRVYGVSSMSPKTLIYEEPGSFVNKLIFLEEGEALVRQAGEINPVAEILRLLLSEGYLEHRVPERDPETNQFRTVYYRQDGPTALLTTTVRGHLDPEIETRMLSTWLDESVGQTKAIVERIGKDAVVDGKVDPGQGAWHAYSDWIAIGPNRVSVPFGWAIGKLFTANAVRARRDINSLLSLTRASALAHRLNREVDERGQIVASLDDYAVAAKLISKTIDEAEGNTASDHAVQIVKAISDLQMRVVGTYGGLVDDKGTVIEDPKSISVYDLRLRYKEQAKPKDVEDIAAHKMLEQLACLEADFGDDRSKLVGLKGSQRTICKLTGMSRATLQRYLAHAKAEGFLDVVQLRPNTPQIISITADGFSLLESESEDAESAVPTVEQIRGMIGGEFGEGVEDAAA